MLYTIMKVRYIILAFNNVRFLKFLIVYPKQINNNNIIIKTRNSNFKTFPEIG